MPGGEPIRIVGGAAVNDFTLKVTCSRVTNHVTSFQVLTVASSTYVVRETDHRAIIVAFAITLSTPPIAVFPTIASIPATACALAEVTVLGSLSTDSA